MTMFNDLLELIENSAGSVVKMRVSVDSILILKSTNHVSNCSSDLLKIIIKVPRPINSIWASNIIYKLLLVCICLSV